MSRSARFAVACVCDEVTGQTHGDDSDPRHSRMQLGITNRSESSRPSGRYQTMLPNRSGSANGGCRQVDDWRFSAVGKSMGLEWVRKPSAAFALLTSAAGVPYVLQNTDVGPALSSLIGSVTAAVDDAGRTGEGSGREFGLQPVESLAGPNANVVTGSDNTLSSGNASGTLGSGRTQSSFPPAGNPSAAGLPPGRLTSSSPHQPDPAAVARRSSGEEQSSGVLPTGAEALGPWAMAASGAALTTAAPSPSTTLPPPSATAPDGQPATAPASWLPQLPQVIRFDINSRWVSQAFPRVQLVHSLTYYDGYQVAIDTGNTPYDIHGQLTYFFDSYDQLRRVTFSGQCGDPWLVVSTLSQHYRLQPEPALGGQLYLTRWNGQITNLLLIKPSSVLLAEDQRTRYQLLLEINRPAMPFRMSDEAMAIIEQAASRGRW